ncbi:hypothetical protein Bbelb_260260 [Branchiostoma belcheri]|nr:hypothetical protein Bbelb_260260 [Branchiostoma belcheri]
MKIHDFVCRLDRLTGRGGKETTFRGLTIRIPVGLVEATPVRGVSTPAWETQIPPELFISTLPEAPEPRGFRITDAWIPDYSRVHSGLHPCGFRITDSGEPRAFGARWSLKQWEDPPIQNPGYGHGKTWWRLRNNPGSGGTGYRGGPARQAARAVTRGGRKWRIMRRARAACLRNRSLISPPHYFN